MEDRLSYTEFQDWIGSYNFRNLKDNYKFEFMIPKVNEYIDQKEIKVFYPRNLLVEDKETELLFFTGEKIYKVTGKDDQEGNVKVDVYFLENIIDYNFEIERESGFENIKLFINFSNEKHLEFNAFEEANSSYRNSYVNKVKGIIKLL